MFRRWLFAAAFLILSPGARAVDFCVQTDAEFATALTFQEFAAGPNTIRLGAGKTFHLAHTAFDDQNPPYNAHRLTLAGGYDATCSAQVTRDAASTVLDGTGAGDGLNWLPVDGGDQMTISTLTIAHLGKPLEIVIGGDGARLLLQRVRIVDSASVSLQAGVGSGSSIMVRDSVFARMDGDIYDAALAIGGLGDDGTRIDLVNTTVTASARNGVDLYNPHGTTWLYNDILYGNNGGFVDLKQNEGVWAFDNAIGSHDGAFLAGSSGNLASNPLFVSSTDYNLQFASPARDSGTSAVPGGLAAYDIEGGARVVGATVDRGAYENDSSGATILLVTNTNDSGSGSLRQALLDANTNPVSNIIGFNIPGSCPRTIAVNTELPAITDGVSIRGYTQPGAAANSSSLIDNATICVELVEANGNTVANGLHFTPAADDDAFDVSGLAIGGFNTGIYVDHGSVGTGVAYAIHGNFIGLAADGVTLRANGFAGVDVRGRVYGTIGGDDDAQRNVIAGSLAGIRVAAEQTNYVTNNFIGTTAGGGAARPNAVGVALLSGLNQVLDNVISGNTASGVSLNGVDAAANTIAGNRIGLKAFAICVPPCTPDYALGNGQYGISVAGGAYDAGIHDNTIAYNGSPGDGAGVRISGNGTTRVRVGANRIYDNAGLGIDVGGAGVSSNDNDATAPAGTANRGLNFPTLNWARGGDRNGSIHGYLQSTNDTYQIQVFASDTADNSGYGEGRYYLGSGQVAITNATASSNGAVEFDLPIAWSSSLVGKYITTLAIDHDGNTSEFSGVEVYTLQDLIFADGFDTPE
jgi:hypothetical protein